MQRYEYKVIPAPRKGDKEKGLKTTEARFAQTLTRLMNEMAQDNWDYLRTDTLPAEERVGLTGRTTTFQHMLVFRKELAPRQPVFGATPSKAADSVAPEVAAPPAQVAAPKLTATAAPATHAPSLGSALAAPEGHGPRGTASDDK